MGVAATLAPNPTKKLAHVGVLLGHMLSPNHAPEISDPGPSLNFISCPFPPFVSKVFIFSKGKRGPILDNILIKHDHLNGCVPENCREY